MDYITIGIIVGVIIVIVGIVFLITMYIHKKKESYKISGGLSYLSLKIDSKNKYDFMSKQKIFYITKKTEKTEKIENKEINKIIYNVFEIYYGFIDKLCDANKTLKDKQTIVDLINDIKHNESSDDVFICGLSVKKFNKLLKQLDNCEIYKQYLSKLLK